MLIVLIIYGLVFGLWVLCLLWHTVRVVRRIVRNAREATRS